MTATSADPSAFWNPGPLLTSVTSPHPMMPQRIVGISSNDLGQEFLDHVSVDIGEPEFAPLKFVSQLRVVEPHQLQDGGVEVVNLDRILDDVVAEIVGLSDRNARLDAASGHPDRERARMVVASQ